MERFIYWLRNCVLRNNRSCRSFCVTCRYYELCKCDGAEPIRKGLKGELENA